LPPLPYAKNALVPHISEETIDYHYGKHHQAYVTNLNKLIAGTEFANKSLEEIIKSSKGGIFNNAAQTWNHTFYWHSLAPNAGGAPTGKIAQAIDKSFGSFDKFKEKFTQEAATHFGSGWVWLVREPASNDLSIVSTHDAGSPLTQNKVPLLTCDVWGVLELKILIGLPLVKLIPTEHAYYIDYRNLRPKYLETYWKLVNWKLAEDGLKK